jgi:hypothetical protein
LVDESVAGGGSFDSTVWPDRNDVVVPDVVDDEAFELSPVPDDGAGQPFGLLEEFSSDRADPAFSERVRHWGPGRGLEDFEAFGSEDLVEGVDELAASVADQRAGIGELVGVFEEQVAGGLGGPGAGRIRGETSEDHLARLDLDEEEDVVAAKGGGVDGEEVTCVGCLGAQELGPSLFGAFRCGVDVVVFEDLLHGRLGDLVAEADEFAVYPPVSPRRVLSGETHNQPAQLDRSWRSADALAGWVGPVSGDSSSVPAQQGLGRDDPALAQSAGECRGDRSE